MFYYTLGNIRPKYRSQLKSIQLWAIVKRPIINKYGINAILEHFMTDLAELEKDNGYVFTLNHTRRSFRGTISFISGDNLGVQEVSGFKVGPGARLKCRGCMIPSEDLERMVSTYYIF